VTDAIKQRVWESCDALWDEELNYLAELVRRPSVRGETNPVQRYLAESMRAMDLTVSEEGIDVDQIAGLPGFSPPEWSYDGLVNVVGRAVAMETGGRSLVLNGHIDVVSAEPLDHWTHDPWGAELVDGRMYGRGAADMKSGVAAMIYALQAIRRSDVRLRGDVIVQTVIDEECSGNGTLSCLATGHIADGAIIPEPTDLSLVTAHPGVLWCRVTVRGSGAHASHAAAAVNAVEKLFLLIGALRQMEAEWNAPECRPAVFASVAHPLNFNIGTVHAGDWPSSVPERADTEIRFSYYPDQDFRDVQQRIRDRITDVAAQDPWLRDHPPEVTFFGFIAEPAVYKREDPIARIVAANSRAVTGRPADSFPMTATIDNRFFELYYDIPNACYGPAGDRLHAPDEWVDLESVRATTKVLAGAILDWCGSA